jgi:hypothetical protein
VLCFSTPPSYPKYPDFESRPTDLLDCVAMSVCFSVSPIGSYRRRLGGCELDWSGSGNDKWRALVNVINIRIP